jgi:hypothetical protein
MYYTATTGRTVGIFIHWTDCYDSVRDYAGGWFRTWGSLEHAVQHLNRHGITHPAIYIHVTGTATLLSEYCTDQDIQLPAETECIQVTVHHLGHGIYAEVVGVLGKLFYNNRF